MRFVWKPALQQAAVPPTRDNGMHVLRHYFASALLEDGVSIKALAVYLGHADAGFIADLYAHDAGERGSYAQGRRCALGRWPRPIT